MGEASKRQCSLVLAGLCQLTLNSYSKYQLLIIWQETQEKPVIVPQKNTISTFYFEIKKQLKKATEISLLLERQRHFTLT